MNALGRLGRGLLLLLATTSVVLWITLLTLQMTLLNRGAVLGWLDKSGAYNHVVESVIILQQPSESDAQPTVLNPDTLQKAIGKTLRPTYVKQLVATVINANYDWLEGKTDKISFTIAPSDKRDELQKQLAVAIEPQLAKLPTCHTNFSGLNQPMDNQCLPVGRDSSQVANDIAHQAVASSDFLTQPITAESTGSSRVAAALAWLPPLVENMVAIIVGLSILVLLCGAGYIALSTDRLAGASGFASRLLFGSIIPLLVGGLLWYFGGRVSLTETFGEGTQVALLQKVIEPIVHHALPAIGGWLTLLSGSIVLVGGGAWTALTVVRRRRKPTEPLPGNPTAPRHLQPATQTITKEPEPSQSHHKKIQ